MKCAHAVAIAFAALSGVSATAAAPKPKEQIPECKRGLDASSGCVNWAADGACDSARWQNYMRDHCQTSCAFCSDGRTEASLAVKVKNRKYGPSQPWHKQEVKTTQRKKDDEQVAHKTHKTHEVEKQAQDAPKAKCKDANRAATVLLCAEGFHVTDSNNAYCANATCTSGDSKSCCEEITFENAQTQAEYYKVLVQSKIKKAKMPKSTLQHKTVKNLRVQQHKKVKTPSAQKRKNCKMLPDDPNAGCNWRLGCDVSVAFMKKHCATLCGFCMEEEHKEPNKVVTEPKKMVTTPAPKKIVTTPAPTHGSKVHLRAKKLRNVKAEKTNVDRKRRVHAFAQESAPDSEAQEKKAVSDEQTRADELMAKSDKELSEAESETEKAEEAAKEVKALAGEVKGLEEKNTQAEQEADVAKKNHEKTMEEEKAKQAKLLGTEAAPAHAKAKSAEPHVAKNPLRSFFAAVFSR